MNEIKLPNENSSTENLEKGKDIEIKYKATNDLLQATNNVELLSDEELNATIDITSEMDSLDCRSECRYNTGEGYKYANYGFSG